MPPTTQLRIDSVHRHLDLLEMLLVRNNDWVISKSTPEIRQAHQNIIDLIKRTRIEYIAVLELYASDNK